MKRIFISIWIGSLILTVGCAMVWAQATAQISGTVRDQSGAVLPGVEITATQTGTGVSRNVVTNETGSYVLPNLPLGPYRLEGALPGFRTYVQTGIVLQVNSTPVINVVLEVGQVTEQIEVSANAALVETRSSTVGSVVENARILELPLNGRDVTELITLAGGAVQDRLTSQNYGGGSPMLAVAGSAGWGTDYTLDGANHVSFMSGTTMLMPFPDAMQEFKVETSGVGAQRGNSAAVAAVTKSGTNELHGNLFEFVRNDLFNARQYFATKHSTLKRNQFGGTIGGPIVKNKLFFFGGYQGTTVRQDPADLKAFIPTAAMLAGDWTAFASPACNAGRQLNLGAPFVGNRVDPALYSKAAMYVVTSKAPLPFPTADNACGEITYGNREATNLGAYIGKVDYQQSASHSLFGRVMFFPDNKADPMKFNTSPLQETGYRGSLQSSYTMGSTLLLGPNTVHSFRLAVNRSAVNFKNSKAFTWCQAGVNIYCAPEIERINDVTISGGFPIAGSGFNTGHKYMTTTYTLNDDISIVRGAHQMAFGFSAMHGREVTYSNWASRTRFNFNGGVTGSGVSDFMLGRVNTVLLARSNPHYVNGTAIALYAADTWKMNSRLTWNYGLRWEPYLPEVVFAIYNFDYERFRQGTKSSVFLNAPAGMYYRGDPGFPKNGVNSRLLQFGPRLGLAWDVSGDGRTSVRASYGLAYVHVPGTFRETYSGSAPWGGRVTLTRPPGGLDDPWRGIPGGNIFPYELDKNAPFPSAGLFYTQQPTLRNPYSQSWNLSFQRQLGSGWLVSTSYMGSNNMHIWGNNPLNPAIYFPQASCVLNGVTYTPCSTTANTDARRRLTLDRPAEGSKISYLVEADDGGTQNYHGMLLSVERRASKGVTVGANYTLSHCIGDYASLYNPMAMHADNEYIIPNNRRFDRGNCDTDRRHIFNLTSVAETPQFANPTLRMVATGWRLSGIYRKSSGAPLTLLLGSDRALNGLEGSNPNQRPGLLMDNPFGDRSAGPLKRYLNPAAFAQPDLGTLGNTGRNSIQGPGTWALDLSLSRTFNFRERQRLEFRVEAYNVTNSFRPGQPNATLNNANFGVIRTSLDPRILQFALKYAF
jgi:hypothetical protein